MPTAAPDEIAFSDFMAARWNALLAPVEEGADGDALRDVATELQTAMAAVGAPAEQRSRSLLPSDLVEAEALDDEAESPIEGESEEIRELGPGDAARLVDEGARTLTVETSGLLAVWAFVR